MTQKIKIPLKFLFAGAKAPTYAKEGDAGMDLYSMDYVVLNPGERKAIHTGIAMAIPPGFVGLIWDRSGMALKHGVKTLAGVVDSGYRGEICAVLCNLDRYEHKIARGDRVAQMLIQRVYQVEFDLTPNLPESYRGEDGFESTGR